MAAPYKLVLVGDCGVGKTSLFHRILFGYFKDTIKKSTLGFDCFEKSFRVLGELVEVELHDSPGKTRFETQQIASLYRSSNAVLLVYSLDDLLTFNKLRLWYKECRESIWDSSSGNHLVWAVIGNKSDLPSVVTSEMVDDLISELNISLSFEVSAKTGSCVEEAFTEIIEKVHDTRLRYKSSRSETIKLGTENVSNYDQSSSSCFC